MTRRIVVVDDHSDHVHIDWSELPHDLRPVFVAALADSIGMDLPTLAKAAGKGEGPDPRFPELNGLVEQMKTTWSSWASWLTSRLLRVIQGARKDDPSVAREIAQILREHETGVVAATTGATVDAGIADGLVSRGLLLPDYASTAPIPTAVVLGANVHPVIPTHVPPSALPPRAPAPQVEPQRPPPAPPPPAPSAKPSPPRPVVPGARTESPKPRPPVQPPPAPVQRQLSAQEYAAVRFARDRAATYMRRPITSLHQAVSHVMLDTGVRLDPRELTNDERQMIGDVIAQAIIDNVSVAEVARRLREATAGTGLTNDMDRVARTEMQHAHAYGAYVTLLGSLHPGEDPFVYKIISPGACEDCRRIWGHSANPIRYKLSAVQAAEGAGGNFRKPHGAWGPTIGPTHPACCCPPLLIWDAEVHDVVQDVAEELRRMFGS